MTTQGKPNTGSKLASQTGGRKVVGRRTGKKGFAKSTKKPVFRGHKASIAPPQTGLGAPVVEDIQTRISRLEPSSQDVVGRIKTLVAKYLGSEEAANLWLLTKSPEFGTAPLAVIEAGKGDAVLAVLESRWGLNPVYA